MTPGLSIPADILERALGWAAQQAIEQAGVESIKCLTIKQAAAQLSISVSSFRKLVTKIGYIDLGEKLPRFSVKQIKLLIEMRTVKGR